MLLVNSPEYLLEKQMMIDLDCDQRGVPRWQARIEEYEFLQIMNESELQVTVMAMLPLLQLEEKVANDRCKYLIGTVAHTLLIKGNQIMIRVGGGFASLEEHIHQVGPFECIKIYKLMKGNEAKHEAPMSFKEAVSFYLNKHKAPDRIVKQFLTTEDEDSMNLFENAINFLKEKQEEAKKKYDSAAGARRASRVGNISGL